MGQMNETIAEEVIMTAARGLPPEKCREVQNVLQAGPDPQLISENAAAQMLGMSKAHLCKWRNGQVSEPFPFDTFRVPGTNQVRYDRQAVREYIVKHTSPAETNQEQETEQ